MKLLRITAKGLPLFKDDFDVNFVVMRQVREKDKDKLYHLFSNFYLNPTAAFTGINASGKTMTLRLIMLAIALVDYQPLNLLPYKNILGDAQNVVITVYFFSEKKDSVCKLETTIAKGQGGYFIKEESFKTKKTSAVDCRKELYDFEEISHMYNRTMDSADNANEDKKFLSDDVSIVIAYNKPIKDKVCVIDATRSTDTNALGLFPFPFLSEEEEIPKSLINFLDPTVERLKYESRENTSLFHLKFVNQNEELVLNGPFELANFLSSGTIKGIGIFIVALKTLQQGGVMIVDEIENHFNKEIAVTLIRFFMDMKLNKKGAVLIFSTHYPELLDEYDKSDSIFITRNRNGITTENLSDVLTRNDIKKSDAYQSGFLGGTTPTYEAYMQLKKSFQLESEGSRE